ncbi:MAG: TRAP-type C4-dicarboxylate transport system permease small subunit [Gammaproteobacteria bacterium]|jgi:TRAP-type C4-dicarboxylate transport system permease small subunit
MKFICNLFSWFDRHIEKIIIIISYTAMAGIIFVEVIRRFVFSLQAPWSTTIPILLFLWLTWFGASYNLKTRTHLALTEVRRMLPYRGQFYCFVMDALGWIVFACIVIFFTVQQVYLSYENFAIVGGTDDVMEWWFYLATPVAWTLIIIRALQNLLQDIQRYRRGEAFIMQAALNG